jgi:CelD/BcsL family acetyltransferase involved in cellulose biosynthesis
MRISILRPAELAPEHLLLWRRLQGGAAALQSPYFCPEFITAVSTVRTDVRVALLEDGGSVRGFFPFQRGPLGLGQPVGGMLSDFHGLIAEPSLNVGMDELLSACRLSVFEFHHLVAAQAAFEPYHATAEDSHYIDLSAGFEGYSAYLLSTGSHLMKDVNYKRRKLARDLGPLRFVAQEADRAPLDALLRWKSEQYQRSNLVDVFSFPWTAELLERLHAHRTPEFAGMLSTLHAGDRLIAVHFGMRSETVWNWWFPRHDEEFARYSPGILLRIYAAEAAPALGIRRIDLGQGDESTYKPRLRSGGISLAAGRIERKGLATAVRRLRRDAEAWVRGSPLLPLARVPGRLLTQVERWRKYR